MQECGHIPPKLIEKLSDLKDIDINEANNHKAITKVIVNEFPQLYEYAKEVKQRLNNGLRWMVIENMHFNDLPLVVRDAFIVGFCALMGNPTPTDQIRKQIIWPVTVDKNIKTKITTFSQHNGEASFHTDTQYFEHPETIATLWCVAPDKNGEGVNALVDGRYIVQQLAALQNGPNILQTLFTNCYPFRVPTIFTRSADDDKPEITNACIMGTTPFIRYRLDTILEGIKSLKLSLQSHEQQALDAIERIVGDPQSQAKVFLKKGDILLTNNHEILHSRTAFSDTDRLLLRVRFNF